MKESLSKAGYDPSTGKIDIHAIETGKPQSKEQKKKLILEVLSTSTVMTTDEVA